MRALVATLLLLLLPGLLLPAGLLLHVCRCAPPPTAANAPSCCSHEAPAAPAERACCSSSTADRGSGDERPTLRSDDCGCVWVTITDDQPDPTRPEPTLFAVPAALPGASSPLPATSPRAHSSHHVGAAIRPPPDHQRSLPLRL
jgi:hypothetical protein